MRKLTKQWPPIVQKRKTAKVGPELYKCPKCNDLVYTGKRSIDVVKADYPEAREGRMDVDHIEPIIAVEDSGKAKDWNKIISIMFCSSDNLQVLCSLCHSEKTKQEKVERAKNRKLNKQ